MYDDYIDPSDLTWGEDVDFTPVDDDDFIACPYCTWRGRAYETLEDPSGAFMCLCPECEDGFHSHECNQPWEYPIDYEPDN